jgi:signal transduction histidine kinase
MQIRLNWRIFIFYVVLGLIPFIILSWFSLSEYARLIELETERKITSILYEAKTNTEFRIRSIDRDLNRLAERDEIQRAFSQFLTIPRIVSLREKLIKVRDESDLFTRISLYSKAGLILADTANETGINENITSSLQFSHEDIIHSENEGISVFTHKIYDFQNNEKLVGYIAAYLKTEKLTEFFASTALPNQTKKIITNNINEIIYKNEVNQYARNTKTVIHEAYISTMDWKMTIEIPKSILFREVNKMRFNNLLYVFFGVFSVALAGYYISRRLTVPINQIVEGTREFASGNLEYRLNMTKGCEIKKLSDAVDQMAEELMQRQNELAQANKLASLGTMSAGIAHEIKNPLAGLKTSSQTIKMMAKDESLQKVAGNLESEVDRLSQIVNNLLDFAKPQNSVKTKFPLNEALNKSLSLINNELKKKSVQTEIKNCDIEVYADKGQLVQVLINLLLNAVSAIEHKNGQIVISAEKEGRFTTVRITDNGSGIAEKDIDKIFDPFYSLSKKGTGLGLSVVYSLLRHNEISINVESEVDIGTTIILTFSGDTND